MKTDKEKSKELIDKDFAQFLALNKASLMYNITSAMEEFINSENEPDGHRRLEDNKAKEKICCKCKNKMEELEYTNYCIKCGWVYFKQI